MAEVAKRSARGGSKPGERRGGRKAGTPNRVTQEFRETVRKLLDDNAENVAKWLKLVAEGHKNGDNARAPDPGRALELLSRLAEFAAPKLGRQEITGADGQPLFGQPNRQELIERAIARMRYSGIPAEQALGSVRALFGDDPAVERTGDDTLGSIH